MKKSIKLCRSVAGGALLPSLAMVLGVVFWNATMVVANAEILAEQTEAGEARKEKPGDKPGKDKPDKGGKDGKCEVCHNHRNPHTITIPCETVEKHLVRHPEDRRGRCEATPVTNP